MSVRVLELSREFALRTLCNCQTTCRDALRFNLQERVTCLLIYLSWLLPYAGESGYSCCVFRWCLDFLMLSEPPLSSIHYLCPELCLGFCSSLLKRSHPSLFSILVSICLFISLTLSPGTQPPFFFCLQANRSVAKNSSVGLLRIYICKWMPMLLVDLPLSKQLKLTNNVGPH